MPERQGTEPSVEITRSRWERVKMSESRTLARERGRSEREQGEERVDSTMKEDRFHKEEGGQARRASLGTVEEGMSG